jgi:hypothetical protein
MNKDLMTLLILCVTIVLLALIFSGQFIWLVVIASIIILTVLILATVNEVDKLSDILKVILHGLSQIFISEGYRKDKK